MKHCILLMALVTLSSASLFSQTKVSNKNTYDSIKAFVLDFGLNVSVKQSVDIVIAGNYDTCLSFVDKETVAKLGKILTAGTSSLLKDCQYKKSMNRYYLDCRLTFVLYIGAKTDTISISQNYIAFNDDVYKYSFKRLTTITDVIPVLAEFSYPQRKATPINGR